MKRRRFFQYAGLGSVGFLVAAHDRAFAIAPGKLEGQQLGNLKTFAFDVTTIDRTGRIKQRQKHIAKFLSESLDGATALEMVAIEPGQFLMGAVPTETDARGVEFPRHRVKLSPFLMSKYPITQAQWSAVAALPRVNRELDPTPSYFQGHNLPVENISWLDAVEFCDRLSHSTNRHYQLPSESQWEYACRAGTKTPFHVGETISSQFADYVGTYTYKAEHSGTYRQSTTPVGSFSANAFGLYDMHGNVWEWCADSWHANYRGAPNHGQAWTRNQRSQLRTVRGGGWLDTPNRIRSASRSGYLETALNRTIGFRVVVA
ncbi:Sulphatase-modifying factor protein [Thalassoporum mexicanum PCC 7367]|uniref:formylglycine-generating enzyme family protein n=1 Tax=Thalassoporum mexicanum TaxID=3457544 RepID=UPI00029FC9E1|nr:formylglycine-generating enzyme family protein [Pseudanabaena sp. PCC 7367]AFY70342.1 Sulphatase-modifying factor protein [Pseudanabaena sp. PCC 7367]